MNPQRILALDVGDRRIGLAITDPLGLTAQPLFTLHRTTLRADLKAIARFIRQHNVTVLVVGNPLHADGTPGAQAAKAKAFAKALEAEHPTLAHHLLDERLTTRDAHELLDLAGRSRRSAGAAARISSKETRVSREEIVDQVAAMLLLEAFLSQRSGPSLLPDPGSGAGV
jgi:putative holliday junction resolvase